METTKDHPDKVSRPKSKLKVFKWAAICVIAVVVVLVIVVPVWLSSESGRKLVLSKINDSVDGKVDMKEFSVGWFKGVNLTDVTFSDSEGTTSLSVKNIHTKPQLGAMLLGNFAFGKTIVDSPELVINVEEPEESGPASEASEVGASETAAMSLAMLDLEVKKGNATIHLSSKDRLVQTVKFKDIESKVNLNPLGRESTFDLSMAVVNDRAESKVTAEGSLRRPKKKWTLKGTSGNFKVNVEKLDLSSLTPLFALAGKDIKTDGTLNAAAYIEITDGRFERIATKAKLIDFKRVVGGKEMILDEPVIINADISSANEVICIDSLTFKSSFCTVDCKGAGDTVDYDVEAELAGLQNFTGQFVDFGEFDLVGDVSVKGKATFGKTGVKMTGRGLAERLVINKGDLTTPVTTANLNFDFETDKKKEVARIASARLMAEAGSIEIADSTIPFDVKGGDTDLSVSADVDLRKIQPYLAMVVEIPKGTMLGGRMVSETSINAKGKKYHFVTDKTSIKNLLIVAGDNEPFKQQAVKVIADVICDTEEKELTINDLLLESAQGESLIKVTKGKISRTDNSEMTKLIGEIEAEYDLAAVSAMAFAYLPQGLTMEGKRSSRLSFDSQYPAGTNQFLDNLNAKTSLGFDKAHYNGLRWVAKG